MQHRTRPERTAAGRALLLAFGLAAVAGCSDSIAFLSLHGFFASFMSGNSTRLAIGLAEADRHAILLAAALIALFVGGVTGGSLLGSPRRALRVVAGLLLLAAVLATVLAGRSAHVLPIALLVPALGAMNTVVQQAGAVSVTPTYITGTLVRLGQGVATALGGGKRWEWLPYAQLWLSLLSGAVVGAALFPRAGLAALWLPACVCVLLVSRPGVAAA